MFSGVLSRTKTKNMKLNNQETAFSLFPESA